MSRRYDLDWLRVIAFGLLMLFHTGMMFTAWDWHVKNLETSPTLEVVMRFLHEWRMPLLFYISGAAVWFLLQKLSGWQFFLNRQKRLLLPLFFGILVVIPPQVYCERLYHLQQFDSFLDFYRTVLTQGSYPEGNLSWHHLWYIPYIWAFAMLMMPLFLLARSQYGLPVLSALGRFFSRPWALFLLFVPSAIVETILRPYYPGDACNLLDDWANFTHKLTFFVAGFVLARTDESATTMAKHRKAFLACAVIAYAALLCAWSGLIPLPRNSYRFLSNFNIWMWLLAALGFARQHLSFSNRALSYGTEAVYPFYILHQTIIVILAYQLAYLNLPLPFKYLLVLTGMAMFMWVIHEFVIRRSNLLRPCFGMKIQKVVSAAQLEAVAHSEVVLSLVAPGKWLRKIGLVTGIGAVVGFSLFSHLRSGSLVCIDIDSPALAGNSWGVPSKQKVAVYLPPSYKTSTRAYPVVYLLPNYAVHIWRYTGGSFYGFRLPHTPDSMVRSGQLPEMIIVVPNVLHFAGGSFYKDSPLSGRWESFIAVDVVSAIDSRFRTIPTAHARAIAGHAAGGTGALGLALKHADTFGTVIGLDPGLFAPGGLKESAFLDDGFLERWNAKLRSWDSLPTEARRIAFRDAMQRGVNSPERIVNRDQFKFAHVATMAPDLSLPLPHVRMPEPDVWTKPAETLARYEDAFGLWDEKIALYARGTNRLLSVRLAFTTGDEYRWIEPGVLHVAELLKSHNVPCEVTRSAGGHEADLGARLSRIVLAAAGKSFEALPTASVAPSGEL